jgi:hypothetical protein
MIDRKKSSKIIQVFEWATTKKVELSPRTPDEFYIKVFFVYERTWWKAVAWLPRKIKYFWRKLFNRRRIVKFDKIMMPNFLVCTQSIEKYDIDIRKIFTSNSLK